MLTYTMGNVKFPGGGEGFTEVYGATLLALRGGGVSNFHKKKRYVTLECPCGIRQSAV